MIETKPEISIIIPVYNVEKYLNQCIDTVINQTFKNLEIILVNDGSSDNSGKICNEYALKDNRIKIIHKKNEGVSSARNEGLKIAQGNFVGFVDSDDFIELDMFEKLFNTATTFDADIVSCNFCLFWKRENIKINADNSVFVKILTKSNFKFLGAEEVLLDNASACTRLYKKSFLYNNNIFFDTTILFSEEILFYKTALIFANKIIYIPDTLYYYRQQVSNSLMNKKSNLRFYIFDTTKKLTSIINNLNMKNLAPWINHLTLSLLCFGYEKIEKCYEKDYFEMFYKFLTEHNINMTSNISYIKRFNNNFFSFFYLRYLILRFLHPLTIYAVLNKNKLLFDLIIFIRKFLLKAPFYIFKIKKIFSL